MDSFLQLLADNDSAAGVAVTTAFIVVVAALLRLALVPVVRRRYRDDPYRRYWAGKIAGYLIVILALVALIAVWAPLGGRLSVILGFATAGIAFAMQEVIGALFGWMNVLTGRIYTVGDRIEIGGVRGDVLDIAPLRTTVMEIGGEAAGPSSATSVSARQPTGRVVSVSNKKTFTEPVFNYSAHFEWMWDELTFTVPYEADWHAAERIVREEVQRHDEQTRDRGERPLARIADRYVLSRAEVEPSTYVRADTSWIEITARFVAHVRTARVAKDAVTRAVLDRFSREQIPTAYPTYAVVGREAASTAPPPPSSSG